KVQRGVAHDHPRAVAAPRAEGKLAVDGSQVGRRRTRGECDESETDDQTARHQLPNWLREPGVTDRFSCRRQPFSASCCLSLRTLGKERPRKPEPDRMNQPELDLVRGTLDLLILKTLSWGPMHGLAVMRWIQTATHDQLQIEEGALY